MQDRGVHQTGTASVYISRSIERGLSPGDIIVFYRTKSGTGPGRYTSVATTIGVVQDVVTGIKDLRTFQQACRKRSVFSDEELAKHWNYTPNNRPFVVNFLFVYSLPRRPILKELIESNVISQAPRGFEPISDSAFRKLLEISNANPRFVVG